MDPLGLKRLNDTEEAKEIGITDKRASESELFQKLEALENENKQLRSKLWNLQFRSTFPLSITLLSIGAVALLSSYAYDSLILVFIGLGLTLWGTVIFYALPRRVIYEKSLFSSISIINSLYSLIQNLGYKGHAIFLHPNTLSGLANGYLFIPTNDLELPNEDELLKGEFMLKNGLLIPAHAQSMVRLLEDELNTNLLSLELADMQSKIEQFFVEDLRIIDSIKFDIRDNIITVVMSGSNAAHICKTVDGFDKNHLGCILCSSIALIISKVTGMPVIIDKNIATTESIKTTYLLLDEEI